MFPFGSFPYRQLVADTLKHALSELSPSFPTLTSLTHVDQAAIAAWKEQWLPAMPTGEVWSTWDWEAEIARWERRTRRRFDMAIWSHDELCGLAIGRPSLRKQNFSICAVQGSPVDTHALKGKILPIVIDVARMYGTALGCEELRFLKPLKGMIPVYEGFDFRLARSSRGMQYCVQLL